jgi:hypothetical protein
MYHEAAALEFTIHRALEFTIHRALEFRIHRVRAAELPQTPT